MLPTSPIADPHLRVAWRYDDGHHGPLAVTHRIPASMSRACGTPGFAACLWPGFRAAARMWRPF